MERKTKGLVDFVSKTKVFFMINSMGVGGAEKSLSSLLSLFDYERYDVYLQMINRGGVFEKLLPEEVHILPGLPYYDYCSKPLAKQMLGGNPRYIKARFKVSYKLRKNARSGNPLHATQAFWAGARDVFDVLPDAYDVAIAWGQGTPTHFVAEKVRAKKKIAWVNADYEAVGHNKEFDMELYGKFDCIVGVSDNLTKKLKEVFPEYAERITTVYDINSSSLIQKMAQEKADLSGVHGVKIATAGRLVQLKGYDIAVEAAQLLKEKGIEFTWLVCGDGPERQHIEFLIARYGLKESFILLGAKANPYPYMNAADIYVQTSRFEGYCLTLTEARILNRPCVTTRFDVVYDQMKDGENGLVVDMNPEAVAKGIIRLIHDQALYAHIQSYLQTEKKGNEEEVERVYTLIDE